MYQLKYHLAPPFGLLNDPNGLVQFRGKYHVFFQWNQKGLTHANKSWGHYVSDDMLHWELLPPALEPVDWYDKNGVYSGSAIVKDDVLYLFYTGNVKDENDIRFTYQCLATSTDGVNFKKHGPLFTYPEGYTAHVRDPKVWFDVKSNCYHMVLGAQLANETGDTILYTSNDLIHWEFQGSIFQLEKPFGYMWECPDVVFLKDESNQQKAVFIFSPQGLEPIGYEYHNIHQTAYLIGQYAQQKFEMTATHPIELDRGFEFYAPQTFVTDDGRTVLYAWMGMMEPEKEETMPTIAENWMHHLSVPRELTIKNGKLYQFPINELNALFEHKLFLQVNGDTALQFDQYASKIDLVDIATKDFTLTLANAVTVTFNATQQLMTVTRMNWATQQQESRTCVLENGLQSLRLLVDQSSLEMFINDGEEVFSLRYFASDEKLSLQTNCDATIIYYEYKN